MRAGYRERQRATRVADHIRIGCRPQDVCRALPAVVHPSVAIPPDPSRFQREPVDHPLTQEPVLIRAQAAGRVGPTA